jgi:hypothetical protein
VLGINAFRRARERASLTQWYANRLNVAATENAIADEIFCRIFANGRSKELAEVELSKRVGEFARPEASSITWYQFYDSSIYDILPRFYVSYDRTERVTGKWTVADGLNDYKETPVTCGR